MFRKLLIGLLLLTVLSALYSYVVFIDFRDERFVELSAGSTIIETSAGEIEYKTVGESGPFVLFLHGTPGGYDQAPTMPGVQVIAPSRPGYLRTSLEVGHTPLEQARAYVALLDALEIEKVVVTGASGGGPSALAFVAAYPERTVALVALEAVSQRTSPDEDPEMPAFLSSDYGAWASLSLMGALLGSEGLVKMLIPAPENQKLILDDPAKLATIESLLWSMWPVSQRGQGTENDFYQFRNLSLENKKITVPTLIVHGDQDLNVSIEQSLKLAEQIPGAVLHVVEGGDHMMPFTHEEEMNAVVDEFFAGLEPVSH